MPAIKYKPSADCAYTQLISKIKGVPIMLETDSNERSETASPNPQIPIDANAKKDVEVKKISSGLMLAQYYNSDSDDEDENDDSANGIQTNDKPATNLLSASALINDEKPVPSSILCPPEELRVMIDKTAAYVLKNGKEFEDILRSKNDGRLTFLQYKDKYHKYYTYKVTGIVCPDPIPTPSGIQIPNNRSLKQSLKIQKPLGKANFILQNI